MEETATGLAAVLLAALTADTKVLCCTRGVVAACFNARRRALLDRAEAIVYVCTDGEGMLDFGCRLELEQAIILKLW